MGLVHRLWDVGFYRARLVRGRVGVCVDIGLGPLQMTHYDCQKLTPPVYEYHRFTWVLSTYVHYH